MRRIKCLSKVDLNGIVDIFPHTSQITSGELHLSFFTNNLCSELGIAESRATMVDYTQINLRHVVDMSASISLKENKELDFWSKTGFLRTAT